MNLLYKSFTKSALPPPTTLTKQLDSKQMKIDLAGHSYVGNMKQNA